MGGSCSKTHAMSNDSKILIGKPEGKKPLGRTRYQLDDNIKMYLKEMAWEVVD
jgi:hypothetical protein